jgi:hypothetical protein
MKKLKGFLQSGIIFIGDPAYMSGDTRPEVKLPEELLNPFVNWDKFTEAIGTEDTNLPFPGAFENSTGRGCAVHTGRLSGGYEVVKEFDEQGKLLQIRVVFHD